MVQSSSEPAQRLARLLSYLQADPNNAALLIDAAEAALSANEPALAAELIERRREVTPLDAREHAIAGLAAMGMKDFSTAADIFGQLVAEHPGDPVLRFNHAWSLAMTKQFEAAFELLDAATTGALPQAAMLEIQLLHETRQFDEARARADLHLLAHPDHPGLLAAISVLAIDLEDMDLAAACAERAGEHSDAHTTLGTVALADDRADDARAFFDRALARNPEAPRALIGKGLVALLAGDNANAAESIEKGAGIFDDHIGSWIAAGWARLIAGEYAHARRHFERALSIDATFAESQGSLAVISAIEDDLDTARRLAETALRLDRQCFSGALAQALVLQANGQAQAAHAIIERALHTPLDPSGKTIAHSLAKHGLFA
ncbi:MAG: tetratricopeptide repeat protein [Phycisphaerales bacterium]|nr:tetratricopeptide repeat protein [Hyphomonadaceae bacterium]